MTDKEIIKIIEQAPKEAQLMVAKAFLRNDIDNDDIQYTFSNISIEEMNEPDVIIENIDAAEPEGIGAEGFTMRTSVPVNNKNYIMQSTGGWNPCIKGKPTDSTANVLSNCVGYSCGRFNEIYNIAKDTTGCKYNGLCCNAENWIERAKAAGLKIGQTPKRGAIMCWQKGSLASGDGAGHVAIVEKVISNNEVYTSESNWGGTTFFNATRTNNNGRWGLTSSFTFRGFIYLPTDVQKIIDGEQPKPTPPSPYPYKAYIKKGSQLYDAQGHKYPSKVKETKAVTVVGEEKGRYKIICNSFNPRTVYCDKSSIIGTKPETYPFNGTIKKGSYLYSANGYRYPKPAKNNRLVKVLGEVNGRYKIQCKYFVPDIVYCDKSAIIK